MKSDDLFLVSLYSDYKYNRFSIVRTHGISIRYTSECTGFLSDTRRNPRYFYPLHVGIHGISIRYTSEPRDFYPLHVMKEV